MNDQIDENNMLFDKSTTGHTADQNVRITAECVRVVYQNRIPSLVSVLIASFLPFAVGLLPQTRTGTFISVCLLWLFVAANFALCHWFNRSDLPDKDAVKWGRFFYVEHFFLAMLLGSIFFYFVVNGIEGAPLYLILVSLGFSAGSVSAFHQLKWAPPIFMATIITPQVVYYFLQQSKSSNVVAVMLLIILVFMSIISLEQHKNWIKTLALSFELESAKKEAEWIARIDLLTGLYNRRAFYEVAPKFLGNAKRYKRPVSVIMLDIDYFKNINDAYGHAVGDTVLVKIAELLKTQLRGSDLVGRMGGEEFAILLPDTDQDGAFILVEKLREKIKQLSFDECGFNFNVTSSFGLVAYSGADESLDALLKKADAALYQAKNEGRDKTIVFEG
nr:diguanylate cyclase [uncultured Desulfuromonas sp.]